MKTITEKQISELIPRFEPTRHKGDGGTVLCVCGSVGLAGAAALSAEGAYRCGAGIVRCVVPKDIYKIVSTLVPEAVFSLYDSEHLTLKAAEYIVDSTKKADCLLIGCGIGNNADTKQGVINLLKNFEVPTVIDADGINCLADDINIFSKHIGKTVITPHPAEAARLLKTDLQSIQSDRISAVKELAKICNGVAVLKGHDTLICENDEVYLCPFGNAGMAKGGSGDILAGMIAGFIAGKMPPLQSAILGVALHALAGDLAAKELTENSMLPRDILSRLPLVFKKYKN